VTKHCLSVLTAICRIKDSENSRNVGIVRATPPTASLVNMAAGGRVNNNREYLLNLGTVDNARRRIDALDMRRALALRNIQSYSMVPGIIREGMNMSPSRRSVLPRCAPVTGRGRATGPRQPIVDSRDPVVDRKHPGRRATDHRVHRPPLRACVNA